MGTSNECYLTDDQGNRVAILNDVPDHVYEQEKEGNYEKDDNKGYRYDDQVSHKGSGDRGP